MIITFLYLLVCLLSGDISVNTDIFIPLLIVEGAVDIFYYMFRGDWKWEK